MRYIYIMKKRGRPPGPDKNKVEIIRNVLKQNPNGIWIRELARKSKLSKSTVQRYLAEFMKGEIEEVFKSKSGYVKIIRLKKVMK